MYFLKYKTIYSLQNDYDIFFVIIKSTREWIFVNTFNAYYCNS